MSLPVFVTSLFTLARALFSIHSCLCNPPEMFLHSSPSVFSKASNEKDRKWKPLYILYLSYWLGLSFKLHLLSWFMECWWVWTMSLLIVNEPKPKMRKKARNRGDFDIVKYLHILFINPNVMYLWKWNQSKFIKDIWLVHMFLSKQI